MVNNGLIVTGWWFGTMECLMTFQKQLGIIIYNNLNRRTPSFFRGVGIPPTRYYFIWYLIGTPNQVFVMQDGPDTFHSLGSSGKIPIQPAGLQTIRLAQKQPKGFQKEPHSHMVWRCLDHPRIYYIFWYSYIIHMYIYIYIHICLCVYMLTFKFRDMFL